MTNDYLFDLIKSLTKTEKRYFKLQSARHTIGEQNKYILIFDSIDKMKIYDEGIIIKTFKKEAFLNTLSITKKRLYDRILAALDSYHAQSSIDAQIYKLLNSSDILFNKALYDQSKKTLFTAHKLASKHERYILLLEINKRFERLHENTNYFNLSVTDIRQLSDKNQEILNHVKEHFELWCLKSELFIDLARHGTVRSEEQLNNFKQIFERLNSNILPADLCMENLYLFHHIQSAYYYAINDFKSCENHLSKNLDLFEQQPILMAERPHSYFSILTNAIYMHEKLLDFSMADSLLLKLKKFKDYLGGEISDDLEVKLFSSISSIELTSLARRGDFDKALKIITVIETGLLHYDSKISSSRKAFLIFKCACTLVAKSKFHDALKMTNTLLSDHELDGYEDIIAYTHFLNLIIHIELKNELLLPYSLRSTERFLKTRNILHPFEQILIRFITKMTKCSSNLSDPFIWEEFYLEIQKMKLTEKEPTSLDYFDFESWARSKVERKSFPDIVKMRFIALAS